METIYSMAAEQVANGARFSIDLENKSMRVAGKYLIKDGVAKCNLPLGVEESSNEYILNKVEELYDKYKHSRPTERTKSKRHYFNALKEEELEDEDLMYGEYRDICQFMLEAYILLVSIQNMFQWDEEEYGKWFWQQGEDKDLVILKKWIA